MNTIAELDKTNFDETVGAGRLPVVVDFYAPWCGPCKMLAPVLEKVAAQSAGSMLFFKVNVDEAPELAERFEITGVPTLLFFKDGRACDRIVGFPSPQDFVSKLIALSANPMESRL
jgi:thioredoxin 1